MAPANLPSNESYGTGHPNAGTPTPGVQGRLSLAPSDILPEVVTRDIFAKVQSESQILPLGQQVPVGINETIIRTGGAFPEAGQVGTGTTLEDREGHRKPIAGLTYGGERAFRPIKLAVIVTASEEYVRYDPAAMYRQLSTRLPQAIARAADLAVVRGQDALRGSPLLGIDDNGYLMKTTKAVELDFARDAEPDLVDQLIAGWRLVTEDEGEYDYTHNVANPSLRADFITHRHSDGSPIFVPNAFPGSGAEINLNSTIGSLLGVPTQFHKSVGGKIGNAPGDDTVMLGGDFSQFCWGYADQITFKVSDSATLDNGSGEYISLWQTNQVAVLCEATFGWLVADTDAFVRYTRAGDSV